MFFAVTGLRRHGCLRLGTQTTPFGLGKEDNFGWNYPVLSAQRWLENVLMVAKNYPVLSQHDRYVQTFAHYYDFTLHKISVKTCLLSRWRMELSGWFMSQVVKSCLGEPLTTMQHLDVHTSLRFLRSHCILSPPLETFAQPSCMGI